MRVRWLRVVLCIPVFVVIALLIAVMAGFVALKDCIMNE